MLKTIRKRRTDIEGCRFVRKLEFINADGEGMDGSRPNLVDELKKIAGCGVGLWMGGCFPGNIYTYIIFIYIFYICPLVHFLQESGKE